MKKVLLYVISVVLGIGIFFVVIYIAFIIFIIFYSATPATGSKNITTHTNSSVFRSKDEKFSFLKKYYVVISDVEDVEYIIDYYDNSSGFPPGPSDSYIRVALKINPQDIGKWLKGYEEIPAEEMGKGWLNDLPNTKEWNISSTPKYYKQNNSMMVIYQSEGIIFERIETH